MADGLIKTPPVVDDVLQVSGQEATVREAWEAWHRTDPRSRIRSRNYRIRWLSGGFDRRRVLDQPPPPAVLPPWSVLGSVMRAIFSICALRSASMACMIAEYFAFLSPFR